MNDTCCFKSSTLKNHERTNDTGEMFECFFIIFFYYYLRFYNRYTKKENIQKNNDDLPEANFFFKILFI